MRLVEARLVRALSTLLCCGLLLVCACGKREPKRPERALGIELFGCAALTRGPICELADDLGLRVIVRMQGHERVQFASDRGPVSVLESHAVEGGKRFHLKLPSGAARLDVALHATTYDARASHALAALAHPPWFREAEEARKAGRLEQAEALARAHPQEAQGRPFALGVLARIAFRRGDLTLGRAQLEEASALFERAGRLSDAEHELYVLAFFLGEELHLKEAEGALDSAAKLSPSGLEDSMLAAFYGGQLARAQGDFERALALMEQCERVARAGGDALYARHALWQRMMILLLLGDTVQVEALYRRVREEPGWSGGGCEEQGVLESLGFARNMLTPTLATRALEKAYAKETVSLLERAEKLGESACKDSKMNANTLHELAHAQLLRGELEKAEHTLARSVTTLGERPFRELTLERSYLRGRIALERGKPEEAREHFQRMVEDTAGERWLEPHARALAYRALAEVEAQKTKAALDSYARMEDALDLLAERAPLGADRAGVSQAGERYSAAHARCLIAQGKEDQALDLALRSASRRTQLLLSRARLSALPPEERAAWSEAVASVQRARRDADLLEERAWQLDAGAQKALERERERLERSALTAVDRALTSLGTLPGSSPSTRASLPEDSALLTFVSTPEGAIALVRRGASTRARVLSPRTSSVQASLTRWLSELSDLLAGAERLYVAPLPEQEQVDFHALPLRGAPLSASFELAYTQGHPEESPYRVNTPASLLVIADPSGDLPGARGEAAWLESSVSRALGAVPLVLRDTSVSNVRTELSRHALFHFAGHTSFDAQAPWRLGLMLSHDKKLGLSDLLTLPSAPALVMLSACEGARASSGNAIGTALVAAGSRVVIAPTRLVADQLSLRFSQAFYTALASELDPVRAAHRAQEELRAKGEADWAAFRVLVP
jgi:tetratricopeptide (TPR) repeat protein